MELCQEIIPSRAVVVISSTTGEGLDDLRKAITAVFEYPVEMRFTLPHKIGVEQLLSWLYTHSEVVHVAYGDEVEVHLFCQEKDHARIVDQVVSPRREGGLNTDAWGLHEHM